MVKIRLSRNKSKNNLSYKIIVSDSRKSLNSKFIEKIGYYNNNKNFYIEKDRLNFWINKGSKISNRINYLIKINKV